MSDDVFQVIGIMMIFVFLFAVGMAVWNIYIDGYTHKCYMKVKSRETGYEFKAVQWRQWKGFFNLYIYNFLRDEYEWKSVLEFENSEKIINQLTKGKK